MALAIVQHQANSWSEDKLELQIEQLEGMADEEAREKLGEGRDSP